MQFYSDPYSKLVFFGQLIHTQDSNDILQRFVVLEDLLDSSGNLVVLPSDLLRIVSLSVILPIKSSRNLQYEGQAYAT